MRYVVWCPGDFGELDLAGPDLVGLGADREPDAILVMEPLEGGGHDAGPCTLHNPHYDFNDEILPLGAAYWATLATRVLAA